MGDPAVNGGLDALAVGSYNVTMTIRDVDSLYTSPGKIFIINVRACCHQLALTTDPLRAVGLPDRPHQFHHWRGLPTGQPNRANRGARAWWCDLFKMSADVQLDLSLRTAPSASPQGPQGPWGCLR